MDVRLRQGEVDKADSARGVQAERFHAHRHPPHRHPAQFGGRSACGECGDRSWRVGVSGKGVIGNGGEYEKGEWGMLRFYRGCG